MGVVVWECGSYILLGYLLHCGLLLFPGCRRDQDGYYWITGRIDDMLNVSGEGQGPFSFLISPDLSASPS